MGTEKNTSRVAVEIRDIIKKLGWSQNECARIIYTELHEVDDEEEITKFQENFKKSLQRATTKYEKLNSYLEIILRQPEAKKLDMVFNKYISIGEISETLKKEMEKISLEIDKKIIG